jgi:uncharacterized protein (DUF2235 family)
MLHRIMQLSGLTLNLETRLVGSMPKNLVFLADGTGNSKVDKNAKTNIAKLHDRARNDVPGFWNFSATALEAKLSGPGIEQITSYDAGVGWEFGDWVGKATGSGISRNIRDGYQFLMQFYEPDDRIFLFGFSRGAYTVRSLGGMLGLFGLPTRHQMDTDLRYDRALREKLSVDAYAVYKTGAGEGEAGKKKRDKAAAAFRSQLAWNSQKGSDFASKAARAPYFIGVFDTVRSLGLPLGYRDWELSLWPHRFHDHDLNPHVRHAYHALCIDDPRHAFHPTIWNEPTTAQQAEPGTYQQDFEQVWFPGVHCDVGGGYSDARLSDITLKWMVERSLRPNHALLFKADPFAGLAPDAAGAIHDPRETFFKKVGYRVKMRDVVKGSQPDPLDKRIAQNGNADLNVSFIDKMNSRGYDPSHLGIHPDYQRALAEIRANRLPLKPPWTAVRP